MQQFHNPCKQTSSSSKFTNIRKVYKDSNYSLSLDKENILNHSLSRIEILFWKNIVDLGENALDIEKNTQLSNFHAVFEGITMFHYFSLNADVLSIIYKKYKYAKNHQNLTKQDRLLPLLILLPDRE